MAFRVVFRSKAQADIANNTNWFEATRGIRAADRWRLELLTTVLPALEADPTRYPQAYESAELGIDLREMFHGRRPHVFRVLFTIDGDTVNVLRVRHAAQDRLTEDDV